MNTCVLTVGDFYGTDLAETFMQFSDDHLVVQAHDPETGLVCALAQAEGQQLADTETEARVQLALYIRRQRAAAPFDGLKVLGS